MDLRIEYVPLKQLAPAARNPKGHDLGALHESLGRFGFVAPIIINESTGRIVAGHGRAESLAQARKMGMKPPGRVKDLGHDWAVPVVRGIDFASDSEAEAYLLADNRLVELGGFDDAELADMLKSMALTDPESLIGTGYNADDLDELLKKVSGDVPMFTPATPLAEPKTPLEEAASKAAGTPRAGVNRPDLAKPSPLDTLPPVPEELAQLFAAREDVPFPGDNAFEVPDLLIDKIPKTLPEKLDTFAGDATPDDGETTYLYIYGSYSVERVVSLGTRAIVAFFTDDSRFDSWWELPAYHAAKMYRAGIRTAIVPDFSNWDGDPRIIHLWNIYRAQWLGRYLQEIGFEVIPRIISDDHTTNPIPHMGTLGVPKHAPVVAMQLQAASKATPEDAKATLSYYQAALDYVEPSEVLVYCNPAGRALVEHFGLPVPTIRYVDSFMQKRAMKMKAQKVAEDPDLKQLKDAERAARKTKKRRTGGAPSSDGDGDHSTT
jgi:hypothetical protein